MGQRGRSRFGGGAGHGFNLRPRQLATERGLLHPLVGERGLKQETGVAGDPGKEVSRCDV